MSTLKVDTINTSDGTGNITVSRPLSGSGASLTNLPAANLTGTVADARFPATLPAISGANLTNLPSGDKRNFIIDGTMTQWPDGTAATTVSNAYTSALWKARTVNDGTITSERSTSVPPVGVGHSSYSLLIKCTGTDASIAAAQYADLRYVVTGTDFVPLHQQQVTFSFWAKTAAANSGDTYYWSFRNGGNTESYVQSFTPTSTWTQFTYTFTMGTVGTWLFTEADRGIRIWITLAAGTDNDDGTIGSWVNSNSERWASSTAISNFMDSTSNEFYITNVGLYLGSSAPTAFTREPVTTVKTQVDYYVQRWGSPETTAANDPTPTAGGHNSATTTADYSILFRRPMRIEPTMTESSAAGFRIYHTATVPQTTNMVEQATTLYGTRYVATISSGLTQGHASQLLFDASDDYIMADARH